MKKSDMRTALLGRLLTATPELIVQSETPDKQAPPRCTTLRAARMLAPLGNPPHWPHARVVAVRVEDGNDGESLLLLTVELITGPATGRMIDGLLIEDVLLVKES